MSESFEKVNDYTLKVKLVDNQSGSDMARGSTITRLFNFLSRQITTTQREWIYEESSSYSKHAGHSAVSGNLHVQNFDDVPGQDEIRLMHAKLIEMKGKPPTIEEIFPDQIVKPRVAAAGGLKSSS